MEMTEDPHFQIPDGPADLPPQAPPDASLASTPYACTEVRVLRLGEPIEFTSVTEVDHPAPSTRAGMATKDDAGGPSADGTSNGHAHVEARTIRISPFSVTFETSFRCNRELACRPEPGSAHGGDAASGLLDAVPAILNLLLSRLESGLAQKGPPS